MKKKKIGIETSLFFPLVVLVLALFSCNETEKDISIGHEDEKLHFKISLQSAYYITRSADDEEEENEKDDVYADDFINNEDIFIGLYDSAGELIKVVFDTGNISKIETSGAGINDNGNIEMTLSSSLKGEITVVALANFSPFLKDSEKFETDNLEKLYSSLYSYQPSEATSILPPIPMTGITQINVPDGLASFPKNKDIHLPIYMKRVMAKITVKDNLPSGSWSVSSVSLDRCLSKGFVNPDYALSSKEFNPEDDEMIGDVLLLKDEKEGKFYGYFPQMKMGDDAKAPERRMTVTLENGSRSMNAYLWLSPYNAGSPSDPGESDNWKMLTANCNYIFNISSLEGEGDSDLEICDEIIIAYNYSGFGKFVDTDSYYLNLSADVAVQGKLSPLYSSNLKLTQHSYLFNFDPSSAVNDDVSFWRIRKEDLVIDNINDTRYQVLKFSSANSNPNNLMSYCWGYLFREAQKIENRIIEGEMKTLIWLNVPSLKTMRQKEARGETAVTRDPVKIRMYWRDSRQARSLRIDNRTMAVAEVKYYEPWNYYYFDFSDFDARALAGSGINYQLTTGSDDYFSNNISHEDVFVPLNPQDEEVDYVYFVN